MKIFGREVSIRKIEDTNGEKRSAFNGYSDGLTFASYANVSTGASNLSSYFRAVDIISDTLGVLPITVNFEDGQENTAHPLNHVFKNHYILVKMLIESVLNRGNGFAYIYRNTDGSVKGLRFLEAGDVVINYSKEKNTLSYSCSLVSPKPIEPVNMIHLKKHTTDGVNGISIVSYARRSLNIAHSTENAAKEFFASGCHLNGVLTVQGTLSQEQRDQIRSSWNSAYTGSGSGIAILPANMSYQPVQLNSEDSQLLQSREFNVAEIARWFGISPVLLGDLSNSSYNTLEAVQTQFLLHTILPYIVMIEEEFSEKLLKPSESSMKINLDESYILRTDKNSQADYYSKLLSTGVLSINEVREELGYTPIENGDSHIIAYTDINQNKVDNKNENEE